MSARDEEAVVAEHIERLYPQACGRDLGPRTRHDGKDGVRVDFTYDQVEPPAAMEVTSITAPLVRALNSDLVALEAYLADLIAKDSLDGDWTLGIRVGSNTNKLRPRLVELIRRENGTTAPARYSASEAPSDASDETLHLLVEMLELGFVSALRLPSVGSGMVTVFPPIGHDGPNSPGFGTLLRDAIACNRVKLGDCRPRETHLVVTLDRPDVSASPLDTPVPQLPSEVDVLWIVLGYYNAKWTYRVWQATRAQDGWLLLDHPVGEAPRRIASFMQSQRQMSSSS